MLSTHSSVKTLSWKLCSSLCTDAAASMTGRTQSALKGKSQREVDSLYDTKGGTGIQENEPHVTWCFERQHQSDQSNQGYLMICFAASVKIWWMNTHSCCCTQRCVGCLKGEYTTGCWNSDPMYTLSRNPPHATMFQDKDWLAKLCYLANIFSKLNKLNVPTGLGQQPHFKPVWQGGWLPEESSAVKRCLWKG